MKVTMAQAQAAIEDYCKTPRPGVRMGQFLMDTLMPGEICSEVYYEKNNIRAVFAFQTNFVEEVGKVLVWDENFGKPVTDEMWQEYLDAPIPEGFEATGEIRCTQMGEFYLNAVCVWAGLPPEAIFEEVDWTGYTHFRVGDGPLKSVDEPPVARIILRRKS